MMPGMQEEEALRYELGKPPAGYTLATWHAFLATVYDLLVMRFDIEAGRLSIPERLLSA